MLTGEIPFAVSPAVVLEYEDVQKRPGILGPNPLISPQEIDTILDMVCARAVPSLPWFRFRPFLNDPKDDLYANAPWRPVRERLLPTTGIFDILLSLLSD